MPAPTSTTLAPASTSEYVRLPCASSMCWLYSASVADASAASRSEPADVNITRLTTPASTPPPTSASPSVSRYHGVGPAGRSATGSGVSSRRGGGGGGSSTFAGGGGGSSTFAGGGGGGGGS